MINENLTLSQLLSDPRIRPVAADAIKNMDVSKTEMGGQDPQRNAGGRLPGRSDRGV